jgi:ssDNA-binding Zn-finger/Zn-ribbon topoisomerase 1
MVMARGGNTHIEYTECPRCGKKGWHTRHTPYVRGHGMDIWEECKYCTKVDFTFVKNERHIN